MRAWLEYTLPEETIEFTEALQGGNYLTVIQELDEELRRFLKYDSDGRHTEYLMAIGWVRERLLELMDDHSLQFYP